MNLQEQLFVADAAPGWNGPTTRLPGSAASSPETVTRVGDVTIGGSCVSNASSPTGPGVCLDAGDRDLLRPGDAVLDAELGVRLTDQELTVRGPDDELELPRAAAFTVHVMSLLWSPCVTCEEPLPMSVQREGTNWKLPRTLVSPLICHFWVSECW